MATLNPKPNGAFEIQFRDVDRNRKTLYLGRKFTKRTAEDLTAIVGKLLDCQANSTDLDRRSTVWLETASPEIRRKLSDVGLIITPDRHTLKELWDKFLKYKTKHVKESTMKVYDAVEKRFFLFFKTNDILDELTRDRMQAWKNHMLDDIEGPTVANYIKTAKAVFNWSVSQGWVTESPLAGVGTGSFANKENDRIVPMSHYYPL